MMIGLSCSRTQGFIPRKCFEHLAEYGNSVNLETHGIAPIESYPVICDAPDMGWKMTHPFTWTPVSRPLCVCLSVCLWMYADDA